MTAVAGWRIARLGAVAGSVISSVLLVRLLQVQTAPGREGAGFALLHGAVLVGPFALAILVRNLRRGMRGGIWILGGLWSVAIAIGSVSVLVLSLLAPALLLFTGGIQALRSPGDPNGARV
ncbi:MAG: hypothetical protein ABR518_03625 [Actinomycetota bacterium]